MSSRSEQPPEDHMTAGSDIVDRAGSMGWLFNQLICDADDSSELHVIFVLGEKAIGKTAVVRSVYDRLDIKRHFTSRAWVRILAGSGLEDILFDVLRETTTCTLKNVDCLREEHLSDKLKEALSKQRYLVVLDNLQRVDLMEKLLKSFVDSRNRSRVVITTCNVNMSSHPGPRHSGLLTLVRLTVEESDELLRQSGGTRDSELTKSILHKCNGYPPAIRLLGPLSTVKEDLPILLDGVPNNSTHRKIISLSYESLPRWLKHCLLYFILFPRESEIPVRRLFNIWFADGLLRGREHEHCTQEGLDVLNKLVVKNMIHVVRRKLDGSAKTCLMPGFLHDILSETAMDVGNSEISDHSMSPSSSQPRVPSIAVKMLMSAGGEQGMVQTNTFKVPLQTRATNMSSLSLNSTEHPSCSHSELQYVAIKMDEDNRQCEQMHMSNGTKTQYDAKFFRSFMLFSTCKRGEHAKDIEMFFKALHLRQCFPLLKVLDLEHVHKPMLPKRLGNIVPNLQYLGLRWTALVSLPKSVQRMSHLDTLDLKHTNVSSVPSSILKDGSLQHLYMNRVCLDRSFCRIASYQKALTNLKTLCGLYIGRKSAMLAVLGKLTGLRKLGLTFHYMVEEEVAKSVVRLTNLQSLRLRSLDIFDRSSHLKLNGMSNLQSLSNLRLIGDLRGNGLSDLPEKLQILTLSMTRLEVNQMQVLMELKDLISLRLFAGSYEGRSMTCTEGTFPKLQVLKLWKLKLLTKWTIEASALPCLKELEIRNCTRLTHIVGLKHVRCLKEITLTKAKGAVATTFETMCPEAVVIADSHPQEGHDNNKEDDNKESQGVEAKSGDDDDREETKSGDDSGTDEQADEQGDDEEEDHEENNGDDSGTDERAEGDDEEEDHEENNGDDSGTDGRAEEIHNSDLNQNDNEEEAEDKPNSKVDHGNGREEGGTNGNTRTDEGEDKERENEDEDEDEAANGNKDGDKDKDKDENNYEGGEDDDDNEGGGGEGDGDGNEEEGDDGDESDYQDTYPDFEGNDEGEDLKQQNTDEAVGEGEDNCEEREENEMEEDENDNEEGDDVDGGTDERADEQQEGHGDNEEDDEEKSNGFKEEAGDVGDNKDVYTDIEGNDEEADLEQQITDEAKDEGQDNYEEREENEEEEDENVNEEGDNDDERNEEGEDEEQQIDDEVDDGNRGNEEEEERQNGAEAEDGDDGDHERGNLNDDDDEGETRSCKMNMKLELNMETKANVKNELTLTVVWKKTKDDE